MAKRKSTRTALRGSAQTMRAIADQIVDETTGKAFNDYFRRVAVAYPNTTSRLAIQIYLQALRAEVDRMADAEVPRQRRGQW